MIFFFVEPNLTESNLLCEIYDTTICDIYASYLFLYCHLISYIELVKLTDCLKNKSILICQKKKV